MERSLSVILLRLSMKRTERIWRNIRNSISEGRLLWIIPLDLIKRQWGFDHVLSKKGKKRVSADVGFNFMTYNLKRILSLKGKKGFREIYSHFNLCFKVFILVYREILMSLNRLTTINLDYLANSKPNTRMLILVCNQQIT